MVQYVARCNTMQYHAIPCKTMQYHASLITADGAYHCPVGSIMAIFNFTDNAQASFGTTWKSLGNCKDNIWASLGNYMDIEQHLSATLVQL